ncbi:hypothetical protein H696_04463 [Fonticula alba]|uniref:Gamma-secretase subunit PEN-2 n=1 Tax=Fonticula alba TaxID=691883 RepID=A0A058Z553_FONAL|nr:hypothetical protein H696_04463 [Fonticula alba]KCV69043.1 hypothetical protein H696_04463 [Fonticula alba]|eukprot:XP_009496614.1 hypothetical protein H696_04463 [Fonticula alba]
MSPCFFLLPWLWVINYIIFRQHLKDPACSPVIKRYINYSLTGAVLLTLPFFVWFILFQTQWQTWGTFGEKIAIVIPRGH